MRVKLITEGLLLVSGAVVVLHGLALLTNSDTLKIVSGCTDVLIGAGLLARGWT